MSIMESLNATRKVEVAEVVVKFRGVIRIMLNIYTTSSVLIQNFSRRKMQITITPNTDYFCK